MAFADLASAMGYGQPGFGNALQTASPLLLAMAQGLKSGQGAFAAAPQGLMGMAALQQQRDEKAKQDAVQQALQAAMGGAPVSPAPTMGNKDMGSPVAPGVPGAMGAVPPQPQQAGSIPGYMLKPAATDNPMQTLYSQLEQKYQLPAGYLARTAQIESGGNPNAKNPNSSAAGLFQFTSGTAKDYGVNPMDPVSSANGAAQIGADAVAKLTAALGRPPTAGEIYLAHQQGIGGAIKLLSNPDAKAVDVVGADAVRNNGGNSNMTAMDFANQWIGKFGGQTNPAADPQVQKLQAILAMPGISPQQAEAVSSMLRTRLASMPQGISPDVAAQLGYKQWEASQPQPVTPDQRFKVVGGQLVDVYAEGGPKPVLRNNDSFRDATPEEAAAHGAAYGQIGPDNRFYPMNPPTGMTVYGPDGNPIVQTGTSTVGKPQTEQQVKSDFFTTQATGALADINKFEGALTSWKMAGTNIVPWDLGKIAQTDEYQVGKNAAAEFGNAVLRLQSGAAMSEKEVSRNNDLFIPQPGDGDAVLARKREARLRAIEGLKAGMTPEQIMATAQAIKSTPGQGKATEINPGGKAAPGAVPEGVTQQEWEAMSPEDRALWAN